MTHRVFGKDTGGESEVSKSVLISYDAAHGQFVFGVTPDDLSLTQDKQEVLWLLFVAQFNNYNMETDRPYKNYTHLENCKRMFKPLVFPSL